MSKELIIIIMMTVNNMFLVTHTRCERPQSLLYWFNSICVVATFIIFAMELK